MLLTASLLFIFHLFKMYYLSYLFCSVYCIEKHFSNRMLSTLTLTLNATDWMEIRFDYLSYSQDSGVFNLIGKSADEEWVYADLLFLLNRPLKLDHVTIKLYCSYRTSFAISISNKKKNCYRTTTSQKFCSEK